MQNRNTRGGQYDMVDLMNQLNSSITSALSPLSAKLGVLEEKVNDLNKDRITRSDLEKMTSNFVQRDAYEARHTALIDRDKQLEENDREIEKDLTIKIKDLEIKMQQQQEIQLSAKDRGWLRISQWLGVLALLGSALEFILAHVKFQ